MDAIARRDVQPLSPPGEAGPGAAIGLQLKTPSRSAEASGEAEGSETHR